MACDNERLKIRLNFYKFLLGSLLLGGVALMTKSAIQNREMGLKEQEHLAEFTREILKNDVGPRLLLAEYFSCVTQSEGLRAGWQRYHNLVKNQYDSMQIKVNKLEKTIASLQDSIVFFKTANLSKSEEAERLKEELASNRLDLYDLKNQLYKRLDAKNRSSFVYDTDPANDAYIKGGLSNDQLEALDWMLMEEKKAGGKRLNAFQLNALSKNDQQIKSAYGRWRTCKDLLRTNGHHVIYPDERAALQFYHQE